MAQFDENKLFNFLKELEIVPLEKLEKALKISTQKKTPFSEVLLNEDLISDANLGKLVADMLSLNFVELSKLAIDEEVLKIIPEVVARKQRIIAFKKDKAGLHLAMNDPSKKQLVEFVEKKVGINVISYYTTKREIENALPLYAKDVKKAFDELIAENVQEARGSKKPEPPIIAIVETTIRYAYQNKASDIHIEPFEKKSLIRFRIDGILHDIVELPVALHPQIVTRVKVLAKLRTDEHQSAQDGKISQKLEKENLDIRVSVVPITEGEKIVMRLLSERSRQFSLIDLGFSEKDLKKIESAYIKPHGMILATGPTGSGKTTTLYAILKLLNKRNVNIMTIEDPVEYDIEGVNQIQVNTKTDLTFDNGLRSIVRQDPDIILVGEIRDQETADISVNAAMTGHLVLSTLHTNDAATTIPRLLDLGVEPFLIGSTVNVIIAQRLVRKICQKCRVSTEMDTGLGLDLSLDLIQKHFGKGSGSIRIYKGKGCTVCHQTGYIGRVGIFEILIVEEEIRQAIIEKKDASEIKKIAMKNGMVAMTENGVQKVKEGITTIDELLRVTKE